MATFQYLKEAARKKRTDILEGFVVMGKVKGKVQEDKGKTEHVCAGTCQLHTYQL